MKTGVGHLTLILRININITLVKILMSANKIVVRITFSSRNERMKLALGPPATEAAYVFDLGIFVRHFRERKLLT